MKNKNELYQYRVFTRVSDDTALGTLFNQVFQALEIVRSMSAPDITTVNGWNNQEQAFLFYEMCLTEMYLHSIIDNLSEWEAIAGKYNDEFHGSWKYYALARRIDVINDFGGEDDDYNEDGSIRTDVSDEELAEDSVFTELAALHLNSIFLSTKPADCLPLCNMILNTGSFSITDIFKKMGKPIKTYRIGKEGEIIQNDWTDEAMQKAEKQLLHEDIAVFFWSALVAIRQLIDEIEKLPKTEDNKEFFLLLPQRIRDILNLRIPVVFPELEAKK